MIDSYGRKINYLRVSVKKKCNLNCSYCGAQNESPENELSAEQIEKIADLMIGQVIKRLEEQEIKLVVEKSAKDVIIKNGTDSVYGARPLKRAIQTSLEDKIAEAILDGVIKQGKEAIAMAKDSEIVVKSTLDVHE